MSNILVDGWTLDFILSRFDNDITGSELDASRCINNILSAILFWDRIDFISNSIIDYIDKEIPQGNVIQQLKPLLNRIDLPEYKIDDYQNTKFKEERFSIDVNDSVLTKVLMDKSKQYIKWSQQLSTNYLPHPMRADYLCQNWEKENFCHKVLLDQVDKEVKEYYNEICHEVGHNYFSCDYPILYDYIRSQADSETLESQLKVALELRHEKSVLALRSSFDELDKKVNGGNIKEFYIAREQIKELSHDILRPQIKVKHKIGDATIGLTPSVNLPLNITTKKKAINLTFFGKLLDFSITKRTGLYK